MSGRGRSLKACRKCKSLVGSKVKVCPNCGGTDFSYDWESLIIVFDPENSEVAKALEITKPGKYALKVR